MDNVETAGLTFGELVAVHRIWKDTPAALRIAADEAVRASGQDPAALAASLCRAMRCGEDDALLGPDDIAWLRAKLEAVTRLAREQGRTLVAHLFQPLWTVGIGACAGFYSEDYIVVETVGIERTVIASSFCDDFEFGTAATEVHLRRRLAKTTA